MLSKRGEAKLVDFGLAKLVEPRSGDDSTPTVSAGLKTEQGTVLGTPSYMSPEQAEGRPVDSRSDVFSFGSVLYEMLTGRRPFQGDSQVTVRRAILGTTPPAPRAVRPEKPAFEPVEIAPQGWTLRVKLHPSGSVPKGMVWVPGGEVQTDGKAVARAGFWLDRYEVTNRQFQEFVNARGYRTRDYWRQPFLEAGHAVSWEQAMRTLVDRPGRPGPSTWVAGAYPAGEDDFPVRGVSWYEAAAYAEFVGKSLPTVHHWLAATDPFPPVALFTLSNFDGRGPVPVGSRQGLGRAGTCDMAGNVKEWCWNASGEKRYTLGGGWDEPTYMYRSKHAQPAFDRRENQGFRLAKYVEPPAAELLEPISRVWRDHAREKPVDDAAFEVFRSIYAYDRTPLDAAVEPLPPERPCRPAPHLQEHL